VSQICVAALQFFLTGEEEKEDEGAESSSDEEVIRTFKKISHGRGSGGGGLEGEFSCSWNTRNSETTTRTRQHSIVGGRHFDR